LTERGLLDTSVLVAVEGGRDLDLESLPAEAYLSVVTLAELHAGVLAARDREARSRRLATAQRAAELVAIPTDARAAHEWARLRVALRDAGRAMQINDLWIAAVAVANQLPVVTQDADFDALAELGLLDVVRV
jgi:predicted nucleic acid-binding protein